MRACRSEDLLSDKTPRVLSQPEGLRLTLLGALLRWVASVPRQGQARWGERVWWEPFGSL